MKKIVSAVALTALAGSLFAADITIKLASRLGVDAFAQNTIYAKGATESHKETDIVKLNGSAVSNANDDLQITAKTDYADATVKLVLKNQDNSVAIDTTYYGSIHFLDGLLNLTGGRFDSRWSARYNTKTTEIGLTDGEGGKFGFATAFADGALWFGRDANNVSAVNAARDLAFVADYTLKDLGGGDLLLKAAAVRAKDDPKFHESTDDSDTTTKHAGFAFNLGYNLPDLVKAELVAKVVTTTKTAYSLVVQPLVIPQKVLVGVTFANDSSEANKGWGIAADIGTVLAPADGLQVIAQAKYNYAKPDSGDALSGLYLYGALGYKINDFLKVALDASLEMNDLTDVDDKDGASNSFTIQPAIQVTAGAGATIQAGFKFKKVLDDGFGTDNVPDAAKTVQTISVPIVFRVSL